MDFSTVILGILSTAIVYMAFPMIRLFTNHGKFTEDVAHKIALWNSIILGMIFCVVTSAVSEEGVIWSGGPAVIYYWINRSILVGKNVREDGQVRSEKSKGEERNDIFIDSRPPQISFSDDLPKTYGSYNIRGNDVAFQPALDFSKDSSVCRKCGIDLLGEKNFCHNCGTKVVDEERINYQPVKDSKLEKNGRLSVKKSFLITITIGLALLVVLIGYSGGFFLKEKQTSDNREEWQIILDDFAGVSVSPTPTPKPIPVQPYYEKLGLTYDQYKLASLVAYDVDEYCEYMAELKNMVEKGTYSEALKKEKVIEYLNNKGTLEYGEKIILYRFLFYSDNEYNNDIVDYLNERNDVTYDEMVYILEELGFAVFEDGTVKW